MNKHPYADILIAIAEGKQIQALTETRACLDYFDVENDYVLNKIANGTKVVFRVKPKTIRIGEYDVPEPIREMPDVGETVWVVVPTVNCSILRVGFNSYISDLLDKGLLHKTKEAAELHAKAIISLSAKKD